MSESLLTVDEVAEIFRVKPRTVRGWVTDKKLVAVRTPGGKGLIRVRQSDVEQLIGAVASEPDNAA